MNSISIECESDDYSSSSSFSSSSSSSSKEVLKSRLRHMHYLLKEKDQEIGNLKRINHKIITRFKIVENNFKNESCSICLEAKGDKIVTYCGHLFHDKCLTKWGKKKGCPVCKGNTDTNLFKIKTKPITKIVGYENSVKID